MRLSAREVAELVNGKRDWGVDGAWHTYAGPYRCQDPHCQTYHGHTISLAINDNGRDRLQVHVQEFIGPFADDAGDVNIQLTASDLEALIEDLQQARNLLR